MNLLPRVLALGLVLVLAALTALLFLERSIPAESRNVTGQHASPSASRFAIASQRLTLPMALVGVALTLALAASLALRPRSDAHSRPPFSTTRTEVATLAKLAESSNAQSAALARERDVRQRAEADALLSQQLLNRSLEEKIRLGRDLHDGIIQSLYAAGLTIESARAVAQTDPAEADRRLAKCLETLNRSIREIRTYIAGLAPESVRRAQFGEALRYIVGELGSGRETSFDFKIDDAAAVQLTTDQTTEALQIAREAVSNALRHGRASQITLRLHSSDNELSLLVQDNGAGFDIARLEERGHGLTNIHARAGHLGGRVRIESTRGRGTRVVLTIPIQPA